jgi:phosphoribosylaminoimidazolecarboxamide formyltransferase/IMP cyclohydrolase
MVKTIEWRKPTSKKGFFFETLKQCSTKYGKELSYNNLLDVDAAVNLINDSKK